MSIYKVSSGLNRRQNTWIGVLDAVSGLVRVVTLGSYGADWTFQYMAEKTIEQLQRKIQEDQS